MEMMEALYKPYDRELKAFGSNWCGPAVYGHRKKTLIAVYEKPGPDSTGRTAHVYCSATPTRFYEVRVLADVDSDGAPRKAIHIHTGGDGHQIAADLARAISKGMLRIEVVDDQQPAT